MRRNDGLDSRPVKYKDLRPGDVFVHNGETVTGVWRDKGGLWIETDQSGGYVLHPNESAWVKY